MDDRVLALCELSNDLLFHKIPPQALPRYVDASLAAGRAGADRFRGREIGALYREAGIAIRRMAAPKKQYGVLLRGQALMGPEGCAVEVYTDSVEELARHSAWEGRQLTGEEAVAVHLAHEFFHIWEYRQGRSVAEELPPVTTLSLLGWKRRAHINRCGEVAAHAFAQALLGLPCLPNFYDYLYLMDTGKMTPGAFRELYSSMEARLENQPE